MFLGANMTIEMPVSATQQPIGSYAVDQNQPEPENGNKL